MHGVPMQTARLGRTLFSVELYLSLLIWISPTGEILMTIGQRIQQARERTGISQTRLAQLLGVTRSACSQWESGSGTSPRRDRLEQIARLLAVNYEWLATGHGPMRGRAAKERQNTTITPEEQELLALFSHFSTAARRALIDFLRALG